MSDTPRTDAFLQDFDGNLNDLCFFACELERENAALREDKARLDWLETNWIHWPVATPADTIRAAIDAARKEAHP